jgi:hypothetical protein
VLAEFSRYTRGRCFLDLFNLGRGEIAWHAEPSAPWLIIEPASGRFTAGQRVFVSVDWDRLPPDPQDAMLTLTSNAGESQVNVPVFAPSSPEPAEVSGYVESHGYVSMEAEHFTRHVERGGARWQVIEGLGRSGDAVTIAPATTPSRTTAASITEQSPSLEFDIHFFSTGEFTLYLDCLPTHPVSPDQEARLAFSMNDGDLQWPEDLGPKGRERMVTNLRRWKGSVQVPTPGRHTLQLWMIDPGVIVDRVTIHTGEVAESYLGPPESFRR